MHYLEAQLPDGRCVRVRETTTKEQARAYRAAQSEGTGAAPNPVELNLELHKMATVAVTKRPHPLHTIGPDGNPLPCLGRDGKPMLKADALGRPLVGRDGGPVVAFQRFDLATLTPDDWRPLTYGELETTFDELFPPKARAVIASVFDRLHVLREGEDGGDFFATIREVDSTG